MLDRKSGTEGRTADDAVMAAGLLVLGSLLVLAGAGLSDQWRTASARQQAVAVEDILGLASASIGGALLVWWVVSLACAAAGLSLEKRGKPRAASVARRMSPAFMQRLVVTAFSFHLFVAGAAHAASPEPGPQWTPTQGHEATSPASAPPGSWLDPAPAAAPTTGLPAPPATVDPGWAPSAPVVEPGLLAGTGVREGTSQHQDASPSTNEVAVLAGDSLWNIVACHLGPEASDVQIALEWPRWYEANKALIGQDPNVLLPGQVLVPPAAS